ncbi:MAG: hypothetical protein JO295_10460 [Verrucomicrobia bacterium]|nr:hypothetical protein [Verrucomicrobiota bacterium]
MNRFFDLARVLESKRAHRRKLAALPLAEKLRLLDALQERALAIRRAADSAKRKDVSAGS